MSAFMDNDSKEIADEKIIANLISMLNEFSVVAKAFQMARDWCSQYTSEDFQLRLLGNRPSSRQYNTPHVSEVAALVMSDFDQSTTSTDIIVNQKNSAAKRISELHQLYMALQYPLLFSYGETGYHEEIPYYNNNGTRKTNREQRLRWRRNNQNELPVDLYHNICDAVTRGDTKAASIGKRIVLPSTFTGSPRYLMQNYQDTMTLCREFGNPDLFITFTTNQKWLEIEEMIYYIVGQKQHDRPETIAIHFKVKLDELMHDLMQHHIFGICIAGVYQIEFQKRGLPHAHILIWLQNQDKCKTPDDIDDLIAAGIPSQTQDPDGYKATIDYMLHGPCSGKRMNAPCIIDKKFSEHFPKSYYADSTIDEDGYPNYRRGNNGVKVTKEWCNRSREIKYIFKYLNKGPDRATIKKIWERRKQRECIGPIVYSHPASCECYYLRILLNILRGPRSFEELRTVDGKIHETFKDACFAYGLINDDREWTQAISEARLWASGAQLRDLFVTILLICDVTNPLKLWEKNWEALSKDILHIKRKKKN
ncbi:uncharacterized protein [Rutidosis leptorrhynchoides]|uniref:uncharacterized protein n=1 Tax=Rutidosis leptorrhynchoides TaxID=125765 RepID=UPI003A994833